MSNLFTISAFTKNSSGVLHRLTAVFTRRNINIESLCVSETEKKGVSRFTISIKCSDVIVRKVVAQISKIIEVVRVDYHTDNDLVFKEIALFKVTTATSQIRTEIQSYADKHKAVVLAIDSNFAIVEKTGTETEINSLFLFLEGYGIQEFVRSGRIALNRLNAPSVDFESRQIVTSDEEKVRDNSMI
jgi:acetolactate synthase I/III small subunit